MGANDSIGLGSKVYDEARQISSQDQEKISQVFISAFLDASLKDNKEGYRKIFQNKSYARPFLPKTLYTNDYMDSKTLILADFNEDFNLETANLDGLRLEGQSLKVWAEERVFMKADPVVTNQVPYYGLRLAWNKEGPKPASYSLHLEGADLSVSRQNSLVLSLADIREKNSRDLLDFSIILEDDQGHSFKTSLKDLATVYPMAKGNFMKDPFADPLDLRNPVFQKVNLDLGKVHQAHPDLDIKSLRRVSLVFDRLDEGEIYIRDIGLAQAD